MARRMQHLESGALIEYLNPGSSLWVDGGHNESAGEAVAKIQMAGQPSRHPAVYLLFGSLNTRDPTSYLKHMRGRAQRARFADSGESLTEDELMDGAKRAALPAIPVSASAGAPRQPRKACRCVFCLRLALSCRTCARPQSNRLNRRVPLHPVMSALAPGKVTNDVHPTDQVRAGSMRERVPQGRSTICRAVSSPQQCSGLQFPRQSDAPRPEC